MKKRVVLFALFLITVTCFSQDIDSVFCNQRIVFTSEPVPEIVLARMTGKSLPKKALVQVEDLRYLTLPYYDFNGHIQTGEMVCHKTIAHDLLLIFKELFQQQYPIHSIRLVDDYDANDEASMRDNNTSCFNYRTVAGTTKLSKHAYGLAVDVNPLQNPWVTGNKVHPSTASEYADRTKNFPHKIDKNDACYRAFKARGFTWGGNWKSSKDYQHFQK